MTGITLPPKKRVLTVDISVGTFDEQVSMIARLAASRTSSYVCCVNAHMTVEARDPAFAQVVNGADLATADGMPVRYAMNLFHRKGQERVAGNDLMPAVLERAAAEGLRVFLYGGKDTTQAAIIERAAKEHPTLVIAGAHAPPFGPLETLDLSAEAQRINESGANIVLVSLGCPKQERWMALMKGRVNAVMIGIGGAFLLYAGLERRAPSWMRKLALEWLFRLGLEPKRLWKRYLVTNSIFLYMIVKSSASRLFSRKPEIDEQDGTARGTA